MDTNPRVDLFYQASKKNLEWVLIIWSSVLLGVWAVKETIALRNFLLVSGSMFSIYYIVQQWRQGDLKEQYTYWNLTPIILITTTFAWTVLHYLFFSLDPIKQFDELTSTWLRAWMASILGFGTGLAVRNHPNRLYLLWLGVFIAFLLLFYQYTPRALGQILVPVYDGFLFSSKPNVVLMGMILIVGLVGAVSDNLRAVEYCFRQLRIWNLLYLLVGGFMSLWAFVYIVDTRNGIGLTIIMCGFWVICASIFLIESNKYHRNLNSLLVFCFVIVGFYIALHFAHLQTNVNKGWKNFFEDFKMAVQIDRYQNWQNLPHMGYPKRKDGSTVTTNTYERVVWATAGIRAIRLYPQGVGLLAYPSKIHPDTPLSSAVTLNSQGIATHSGWIELGLAFGIPSIGLLFSALLITFVQAVRNLYPARMTVLGFVVLIFCLYAVAEISTQHGLEILYYLLTFLPALLFIKSKNI